MEINEALAKKVLEVVDAGLTKGVGFPKPGQMCVEAAVCYAMGEEHNDRPLCVNYSVRNFKITLNDCSWSSDQARAKGMRRLAIAQLGTADTKTFQERESFTGSGRYYSSTFESKAASAKFKISEKYKISYGLFHVMADDMVLSELAEEYVQILIEMGSPGAKFLYLTEGGKNGN